MIVLASGSPYRRELLTRLGLAFRVYSPDIDESPGPGEAPALLAERLAREKALAVQRSPQADAAGALIIGSDQVATLDGITPIGKPGNHERAVAQLRAASARTMVFHTAVCLLRADGKAATERVETRVRFRELEDSEIERYLRVERPYDCAGAAKSEGLGIRLLAAIEGPDPTALIGLPLIALCGLLIAAGADPLSAAT
ncbi:MAG: Maf family nucleotide pyrophosphatase [Burkholderiaceae bacterium]